MVNHHDGSNEMKDIINQLRFSSWAFSNQRGIISTMKCIFISYACNYPSYFGDKFYECVFRIINNESIKSSGFHKSNNRKPISLLLLNRLKYINRIEQKKKLFSQSPSLNQSICFCDWLHNVHTWENIEKPRKHDHEFKMYF